MPKTTGRLDPVAGLHEQHCLLSLAQLTRRNDHCISRFPGAASKVYASMERLGDDHKMPIGNSGIRHLPLEQEPVSTEERVHVRRQKRVPKRTRRKMGIEVADAIEPYHSRHDPVAPDLVAAADSGRVVVGGMAGVAVRIGGIRAEPRPPVTSEMECLDQHRPAVS